MGKSAPRQPGDVQASGDALDEASTEAEQETQPQPDPPGGDATKDPRTEPGPQSKFHG